MTYFLIFSISTVFAFGIAALSSIGDASAVTNEADNNQNYDKLLEDLEGQVLERQGRSPSRPDSLGQKQGQKNIFDRIQKKKGERYYGGKCRPKSFGKNQVVCVCDSNYCDTIPPPDKLLKTGYMLQYTSTQEGMRLDTKFVAISQQAPSSTENLWKVNSSLQYQEILGFGGGLTDSAGLVLTTLSERTQQVLVDQYYGSEGINYCMLRYPMGGTDFSARFYTYDDGPDKNLSRFSLAQEDYNYKIPFLNKMENKKDVKIIGTPWSPPESMMEPRNETMGYTRLRPMNYDLYAWYFLKFLNTMKKCGFKVWGVSPQNEPGDGYNVYFGINSCGYSPEEQLDFISNHLCPTLRNNGHSDTVILQNDDQRTTVPEWPDLILSDPKGYNCVNGTALHWYFDDRTPASSLVDLQDKYPDKFILYTEASFIPRANEMPVQLGDWGRLERLCFDMIDVFNHRVVGWIDWNMLLNQDGGPTYLGNFLDAPIIVNAKDDEFYKQPIFYCLAHFSKFVPPGSRGISTQSTSKNVNLVGFLRPDNVVSLIILNRNDTNQEITLQTEDGSIMTMDVPAHSLHTVLYRK